VRVSSRKKGDRVGMYRVLYEFSWENYSHSLPQTVYNGRNCHLRKEVQLRGVFRFSEIIAIIVSCGRRSVEMGRSNE